MHRDLESRERNAPLSNGARKEQKMSNNTEHQPHYNMAGEGQSTTCQNLRVAVALFKGLTATTPEEHVVEWPTAVKMLTHHDVRTGKDGRLWSPVSYGPTKARKAENVAEVSCLVLDFDDGARPEELTPQWEEKGLEFVIHTTHSHKPDEPKWRAIFPLAKPVPASEWEATYKKLTAHLAGGRADRACKDVSRIYYLPSCKPGAEAFAEHNKGRPLDPDAVPEPAEKAERQSVVLPAEIPKGKRNPILWPWACSLRAKGLEEDEILARLRKENAARCKPPLEDEEVRGIAHRAAQYPRGEAGQGARRENIATALVALAEAAGVDVWQASNGEQYASVPVGEHTEHWPLDSEAFRAWLEYRFYQEEGRVATGGVDEALLVLRFKAMAGPKHPIYTRIAEHEGAVYIDLADDEWRAVRVTPAGWEVVSNPPVRFRRPNGLLPLPTPEHGGRLDEMRRFINVTDEEWPLVAAWMVAALAPSGPYPVLLLKGEQGSAKSTTARAIKRLLDPHTVDLRKESHDPRNLAIAANNTRILALDNLSVLAPWLSDYICTLSTGGGYAIRKNYTDNEETLFNTQAPVILNGIGEIATRADLLDRALLVTCPRIPEEARRPEREFWPAFDAAKPRLLGAVLDALAGALAKLPEVKLTRLPRMADFAVFATATARAGAFGEEAFWHAYDDNRENAHVIALEGSPVAEALIALIEDQAAGEWKSTPSALLDELRRYASEEALRSSAWPRSARGLTAALTRLAPNLRAIGYDVDLGSRSHGKRITRITRLERVPVGVPVAPSGCLSGCRLDDDRHPQKASKGAVSGAEGACGDGCPHTLSMHTLGEKEEKEGGEGVEVKGKDETGTTGTTGTPTLAGESGDAATPQNTEPADHQDPVDDEIDTCACGRPAVRYSATGKPFCSECFEARTEDGKAGPGDANDAKNTIFSVDPRGEREGAPAGESEETPLAKEYENGVIGVTGVTAAKSQNTETPADAQAPVGDEEIGPCIRFTIDGQEPPEMITLKV